MIIFVSKNHNFVTSISRLLSLEEHDYLQFQDMEDVLRSESLRQSRGLILEAPSVQLREISYCNKIKAKQKDMRMMVVSADLQPETKLALMEHGVDIYSDDPPNLFLAKIGKFKLLTQEARQERQIKIGRNLVLDVPSQQLIKNGTSTPLPKKEFELLLYFCQNRGRALSTDVLCQKVWDEHTDTERVRRYVAKLRQKIEADPAVPEVIIHQRGVGYLFMALEELHTPITR